MVETTIVQKPLDEEQLKFQKLLQFANLAKLIKKDLNENKVANSTF